jgi:hypothetical protein
MIGFIDTSFCNLSLSQSTTRAHNKCLPKTRSILTGLHLASRLVCLLLFYPGFCILITLAYKWIVSECESYVRTDGQSAGLSWHKAPIWGLRTDSYYYQAVSGWLMWGAFSDDRRVCRLQLLLVLGSAVILRSESRGTRDHILLSQIRDFPFRSLQRFAGLRWRYSTPSPYGIHGQVKVNRFKVKVRVPLRLAVYRQSVRLGVRPLEVHDQRFFPTELLR